LKNVTTQQPLNGVISQVVSNLVSSKTVLLIEFNVKSATSEVCES
jgi:hypothetical protein